MNEPYLKVTYRHGRALAAYYRLPGAAGGRTSHTRASASGLVVDFAADGRPRGIEITAPSALTLAAFNAVLGELGLEPVDAEELAPLHAT